ncbi:MAG: MFS transporter [Chloroflexi bacterium]|nr:MFS transporter [Chloroflexota bacterium]
MLRPLARVPTFRSVVNRDWRTLWMAGHLWHLAFWMDLIVLGWLVLELTDSPLLVALVGTFRLIPLGVLGPIAGSVGDRLSKRRMLLFAQSINITATVGFTLVLLAGREQVWLVYTAAMLTGTAWAIDFPVRRAFIRDLLPGRFVVNAMAIDAASLTGMQMVGRWIGGGILAIADPTAAYGFLSLGYRVGFAALLRVPESAHGRVPAPPAGNPLVAVAKDLASGLVYVLRNPVLRNVFLVTVAINLFIAPYLQITPVFARDVFGVGPALLGIVSGMDGLGALIGTMVVASMVGLKRLGRLFIGGCLLLGFSVAVFSQVPAVELAIPVMIVVGFGVSGFVTMQTTISVLHASPEMRGRAMGAVALGIGGMPIGMALLGSLAEAYGAPMALGMTASTGLLLILAVAIFQPALRRAQ